MFFDNFDQIPTIAARTSCSIFVVPPETHLNLPHALYLRPDDDKKTNLISIESLRDFLALAQHRETQPRFFVVAPADAMNEPAQNAFLKTFEEPKPNCHFILLTEHPLSLLPTILSRAQIFYPRPSMPLDQPPIAQAKVLALAKKLITAEPNDLIAIAEELSKTKTKPREQALSVVATAIELLYKSYFKTNNPKFLTKLPHFINLYNNLSNNGHIKLHLVADLF